MSDEILFWLLLSFCIIIDNSLDMKNIIKPKRIQYLIPMDIESIYSQVAPYISNGAAIRSFLESNKGKSREELTRTLETLVETSIGPLKTDYKIILNLLETR